MILTHFCVLFQIQLSNVKSALHCKPLHTVFYTRVIFKLKYANEFITYKLSVKAVGIRIMLLLLGSKAQSWCKEFAEGKKNFSGCERND